MCRSEFITNFNFGCKVNYVVFIFASSLAGWTFNLLYDYSCINTVRGSLIRSLPFSHKKQLQRGKLKISGVVLLTKKQNTLYLNVRVSSSILQFIAGVHRD